jgi:hypothetical protein
MNFGDRFLRLSCAVAATVAGFVLVLLEAKHFENPIGSIVVAIPVIIAFSLISWPVALAFLFGCFLASIVIFALPFRFRAPELLLWGAYALLIGPALSTLSHISTAFYNAQPGPPGGTRFCVKMPDGTESCGWEVKLTPAPNGLDGARPATPDYTPWKGDPNSWKPPTPIPNYNP